MGWGEINPWQRQGAVVLATALIMLIVLFGVSHMKAAAFRDDATHLGLGGGYDGIGLLSIDSPNAYPLVAVAGTLAVWAGVIGPS